MLVTTIRGATYHAQREVRGAERDKRDILLRINARESLCGEEDTYAPR